MELDTFARPWAYGYALIRARRFDEALKELSQRSEGRPDSAILHAFLSDVYAYKGEYESAVGELKKALVIQGDEAVATKVDRTYSKGGCPAVNLEFLSDMKRRAAKKYVSRLQMAEAGARAGHREEAIKYLEQAFELRDPLLVHMQRNPNLDALHSEPAYWAIVKKWECNRFSSPSLPTVHFSLGGAKLIDSCPLTS